MSHTTQTKVVAFVRERPISKGLNVPTISFILLLASPSFWAEKCHRHSKVRHFARRRGILERPRLNPNLRGPPGSLIDIMTSTFPEASK